MISPTNMVPNRGFALLLSLIISSVVLAIGLTLLSVALKQLNLSATGRESEIAFQMANLGMECGRYWRDELRDEFVDFSAPANNLTVDCVGDSSTPTIEPTEEIGGDPDVLLKTRYYRFDNVLVGTETRCLDVFVTLIENTSNDDVDVPVGRVSTNCDEGDICTVIISQGYNRSCTDIESSLFSVQRELTAEF